MGVFSTVPGCTWLCLGLPWSTLQQTATYWLRCFGLRYYWLKYKLRCSKALSGWVVIRVCLEGSQSIFLSLSDAAERILGGRCDRSIQEETGKFKWSDKRQIFGDQSRPKSWQFWERRNYNFQDDNQQQLRLTSHFKLCGELCRFLELLKNWCNSFVPSAKRNDSFWLGLRYDVASYWSEIIGQLEDTMNEKILRWCNKPTK